MDLGGNCTSFVNTNLQVGTIWAVIVKGLMSRAVGVIALFDSFQTLRILCCDNKKSKITPPLKVSTQTVNKSCVL